MNDTAPDAAPARANVPARITRSRRQTAGRPGDSLKAIGLMCVAVVLFSGLDASAKYLVTRAELPVVQIVWMRFAGQFVIMLSLLGALPVAALLGTRKLKLELLRSLLMVTTTAFNFLAVKYLRLDQTITIVFLTPLVVALLAGPVLGEWVGWRRIVAILVGFCGILIAVRPGVASIHPAIGYSVLCDVGLCRLHAGDTAHRRLRSAVRDAVLFDAGGHGRDGAARVFEWVTPETLGNGCGWRRSACSAAPATSCSSSPTGCAGRDGRAVSLFSAPHHDGVRLCVFDDVPELWQLAGAWCRRLGHLPPAPRARYGRASRACRSDLVLTAAAMRRFVSSAQDANRPSAIAARMAAISSW